MLPAAVTASFDTLMIDIATVSGLMLTGCAMVWGLRKVHSLFATNGGTSIPRSPSNGGGSTSSGGASRTGPKNPCR